MNKKAVAQAIVNTIWMDLSDRSGLDLGYLDPAIQEEIRQTWLEKIETDLGVE